MSNRSAKTSNKVRCKIHCIRSKVRDRPRQVLPRRSNRVGGSPRLLAVAHFPNRSGRPVPGPRLVGRFASLAGVDPKWAMTGKGPVPELQTELPGHVRSLAVIERPVDAPANANLATISPNQRVVTAADYGATRYLFRVPNADWLAVDQTERILPGDLLLIETDAERWLSNESCGRPPVHRANIRDASPL